MNKLKMQSLDVYGNNVQKIAALFPQCVTERLDKDGKPELAIDFDKLRAELSNEVLDEGEERYQFTWPDKRAASRLANTRTTQTLRPCREESVDFNTTQNLYIEGDNLDVLKVLRETYLGKVKMIYIDPPYNTGNDFVYNDDFAQSREDFEACSGAFDEEGNQLIDPMQRNTESNGRFHTDWLNMIYPRLKVARDLLSDDGVIFISIGQDEITNLAKLADEIFGVDNRINIVTRIMKSGGAKGHFFSPNVEFLLVYAKSKESAGPFREAISKDIINKLYTSVEDSGIRKGERYRPFGLYQSSLDARPNQRYYIECPDGSFVIPPGTTFPELAQDGAKVRPNPNDGCWRWSRERYLEEKTKGNITFKKSNGVLLNHLGQPAEWNIYSKIWLSDRQEDGATPIDHISKWENRHSAKELQELEIPFDFAKPTGLIKYLIDLLPSTRDSIILDFFSGSATTAHAVMKLNAEDGGHRKFIMIQLPEVTDEKSEARKAGYKNICEIGKERIRRAGKQILESVGTRYIASAKASAITTGTNGNKTLFDDAESIPSQDRTRYIASLQSLSSSTSPSSQFPDVGFRVLKLDSSNMEDVYYTPDDFNANNLFTLADNIKTDRTSEDLLFQVMLDLGIELSAKIEKTEISGKEVWCVDGGYLMACFDREVNEATITEIAKQKPVYFVMRDASAANDNVLDNFDQLFANYSPDTTCKIL